MKRLLAVFAAVMLACALAQAGSTGATVSALRMAGTITGGLMPSTAPEFAQMVQSINSGDYFTAAMTAVNSQYFPKYLVRRMAKEMMNPSLNPAGIPDNDATTFIVANLIGSGTQANISKLWSDNATYLIKVAGTPTHAMSLSAAQLAAVNWKTDLVRQSGQMAVDTSGNAVTIPQKHVGGFMTLSNSKNDNSFAQFGFTAGTNLRAIEGMWEIATGYTLQQMVVAGGEKAQLVPKFVPEQDPNFFVGNGQPACISCHAGGASNLTHGYSALADVFDFTTKNGFTYISAPTTTTMKSLGSTAGNRSKTQTCNLAQFTTCNPDSYGADPNQGWDLTTWQQGGLLSQWGWTGSIAGEGLNELGAALGQAGIVYQFLVKRVIQEICPLGSISASQQATIASTARSQDSFGYIVAAVASDPSCR